MRLVNERVLRGNHIDDPVYLELGSMGLFIAYEGKNRGNCSAGRVLGHVGW